MWVIGVATGVYKVASMCDNSHWVKFILCDVLNRHLLSLKHYEGDIEDLDLNFTLTIDDFGQSKVGKCKMS